MQPPSPAEDAVRTRLLEWECAFIVACNRHMREASLQRLYAAVSRMGDGPLWFVLGFAFALFGGASGAACALHMAIAGAMALTLYKLCKRCTGRPRPCMRVSGLHLCVRPLDEYSFPSGHTLHAVAFTTVVAGHYPALGVVLVPFALLTALSRVALGLHYPTDVLGGALIGAAVAAFSASLL